jgi:hypothetical protein
MATDEEIRHSKSFWINLEKIRGVLSEKGAWREQSMCSAAHCVLHFPQLQSLPGTLLAGWQAPAKDWQENSSCGLRRWEQEDPGQNEERSLGLEVKTSLSPFAARGLNQGQPTQATSSSPTGLCPKTNGGVL